MQRKLFRGGIWLADVFSTPFAEEVWSCQGRLTLWCAVGILASSIGFFYYSPTTPNMSLAQLIVYRYFFVTLLAIFMAYAYMKTQNIWLPAMIHFVTNSIEWIGTVPGNKTVTWEMLSIIVLIKSATYLPFLFTKTFR